MDTSQLEVMLRDLADRVAKMEKMLVEMKRQASVLVAILPDGPPDPGKTA